MAVEQNKRECSKLSVPSVPLPQVNGPVSPDLSSLGDEAFERLCLHLARADLPDVRCGDLHGLGGRTAQNGVDFLVESRTAGLFAGSCRSDANPARGRIVGAAREFADAWETVWKPQNVTRFILCLACEVRTPARKSAIKEAEAMVRSLGIECETWSLTNLTERLRHHPAIVAQFLGAEWAHRLCAPDPLVSGAAIARVEALRAQIRAYEASQGPLVAARISALHKRANQGFAAEAAGEAAALEADPDVWHAATPKQKATLIRLTALAAWPHDPNAYANAVRRAQEIDPSPDRYFEARTAHGEQGPAAAFQLLDHPRTARERTYRAALSLDLHGPNEALTLLGDERPDGPDASWHERVRAVAEAKLGRIERALEAAEAAVRCDPEVWASRMLQAALVYNATLSPALGLVGLDKPRPFPPTFLKQDPDSVAWRRQALTLFEALEAQAPEEEDRQNLAAWRFAHFLLQQGTAEQAETHFQAELDAGTLAPGMVDWMIARGLSFDAGRTASLFEARLSQNPHDLAAAAALISLYQLLRDPAALRRLLDAHGPSLLRASEKDMAHFEAMASSLDAAGSGAVPLLLTDEDAARLTAQLADDAGDPVLRYESARALAHRGNWGPVLAAEPFLLKDVATASAFELAANARAMLRPGQPVLDLIDHYKEQMTGGALSPEMETLRIDALANSGDLAGAINAAEYHFTDPAAPAYLSRAYYLVSAGNIRGAATTVRRAADAGNPALCDVHSLMSWAHTIGHDDIQTARRLTRTAFALDSEQAINFGAAFLALEIMPDEAEPYMRRMHEVALANPTGPIRLATFDETRDMMLSALEASRNNAGLYAEGRIFGHAILGKELALHYLTPFISNAPYLATSPQIAHALAGRARDPGPIDTLVLDTTAILMAEGLGLWPALERAGFRLILPSAWSGALLEMQHAARPNQADYRKARQQALQLVSRNQIRLTRTRPAGSLQVLAAGEVQTPTDIAGEAVSASLVAHWETTRPAVFLAGGLAETLARSGILADLARAVRLCMSPDEHQQLLDQERRDANGEAIADRLTALRQRFFIDIRDGRVRTTGIAPNAAGSADPHHDHRPGDNGDVPPGHDDDDDNADDHHRDDGDDVLFVALRQVIASNPGPSGALWIDDRFLTGHGQTPHAPILGIQTILWMLQDRGALSEPETRSALRKMRQFGFSHLLPAAEEIVQLFSLIANGAEDAEQELKAARHAFSRFALIPDQALAAPGQHAVPEQQAAPGMFFLANRVIQHILETRPFGPETELQAILWTIDHLRMDWRPETSGHAARVISQAWYASLVLAFLGRAGHWFGAYQERARDLLQTIYERRIRPALHADPAALSALNDEIAGAVRDFLVNHDARESDAELRAASLAFAGAFCDICPGDLNTALVSDPAIRNLLGIETCVEVGGVFFPTQTFWDAFDRLSEGRSRVRVRSAAGDAFWFSIPRNGQVAARCGETQMTGFMSPAIFSPDAAVRRDAFNRRLAAIGLCAADAAHLRRRFGRARTALRRAELLGEISGLPEGRVARLERKANGSQVEAAELAPPGLETMAAWLGYEKTSSPAMSAFNQLAGRCGMPEAVRRWSHVPVALPASARDWLSGLADDEVGAAAADLSESARDAVSRRNLLTLFAGRADLATACETLLTRIESETTADRIAHLNFARAATMRLAADCRDEKNFPAIRAAAWAFAGLLVSRLALKGVRLDVLSDFSLEAAQNDHRALFHHLHSRDAGDPNVIEDAVFLAGLGEALLHAAPRLPGPEALRRIVAEISVDGAGAFPSPICLRAASLPNRFGTWLTEAPVSAIALLGIEDDWTNRLLTNREQAQLETLRAPLPDLARLLTVGTDHAGPADVKRLLRAMGQSIARLSPDMTVPALLILAGLEPKTHSDAARLRKRYGELAARQTAHGAAMTQHDGIMFKLIQESAAGILRQQGNNWPAFEDQILHIARNLRGRDRHNMANAIRAFANVIPIEERHRILRIAAQINMDFPDQSRRRSD